MQRTDWAEVYLEKFSSIPLTWENVFRSTEYFDKTNKEVVDLLLVLRNEGIFISMKCQESPKTRKKDKLKNWVNKSAKSALNQVRGGIKTSQTRNYWCEHPRRGKVSFCPKEIKITHAVIIVETLELVRLSEKLPLALESTPVFYFSVNDFFNIIKELRTIRDIQRYLNARQSLSQEILRSVGLEKALYEYYILNNGFFSEGSSYSQIVKEVKANQSQIHKLMRDKCRGDKSAYIIEHVSDALSKRLEGYDKDIDQGISAKYDPPANRKNYILMQNELCDLVLDERRKIGAHFSEVIEKAKNDAGQEAMVFQAVSLDSKSTFQYVLSASKGVKREEIIKRSEVLIRAALSEYDKKAGMIISYNHDIDNYEVLLVKKFEKTEFDIQMGKQFFTKLKMKAVPIEMV